MQKRTFLKLLSLMLLSFSSHGNTNQTAINNKTSDKRKVLVIGAGLAGLTAAWKLQNQGYDVLLIEARQRIGGRIWTSTKWADIPLDLGATWIHGAKNNPLTDLADKAQAERLMTYYAKAETYNTDGQALSVSEEKQLNQLRKQIFKQLRKAQNREDDVSIKQALEPLLKRFSIGSDEYRFINFILSSDIEQEYSGSIEKLSTHWFDNDKDFRGNDVLFVQGFKVITEFLAQQLSIKLGETVKEIHWHQQPLRVITQKSEFLAEQVIITLPLGILQAKKIQFTPALPEKKQKAIQKIGVGVLNKCYLRFPNAFWSAKVDWIEHIAAQRGVWSEWVSFQRALHQPILLGFNAAERGREIEQWSDDKVVADAMKTLKMIYGENTLAPLDYQITRWASDPFALGSYSYNLVGASPGVRKIFAAPIDKKLFFAGEAAETHYFGTAHGAYLSGLRVAEEVLGA